MISKINGLRFFSLSAIVLSLLSFSFIQNSYAAVPTVVSAKITGANTITIVYNEPVTTIAAQYAALALTAGGSRSVSSISGSGSATILITFSGAAAAADETGTIDIAGTVASVANPLDLLVALTGKAITDGQTPLTPSIPTSSAGLTIDNDAEGNGFGVTASLSGSNALAGDTLVLLLDGSSFQTRALIADDITAGQYLFTISKGQLGSDGVKTITSRVTDIAANVGSQSLQLIFTLNTAAAIQPIDTKTISRIFDSIQPTLSFAQIENFATNNEHVDLDSKIQTQHVMVGEPLEFSMQVPADQGKYLQKAQLYLNLRGIQREIHQSDTYIQYDKFNPLVITDPHGYFSNVDVNVENANGFLNYKFTILFDKTMEQSNLILQYIDEINNFKKIELPDALQVDVSTVDDILQQIAKTLKTTLKEKQIQALNKWGENGKKIDSDLFQIINSPDPDAEAKRLGLMYKDGKTKVIVGISESKPELLQQLQTFGQIDFISDKYVQMNLDLNKLSNLVEVNDVQKIRIPNVPIQHESHVSEVGFINADLVQFAGITGRGVKVAVIDFAFDLNNPKILPNIAYTKSFRYGIDNSALPLTGLESEYIHGTAVAELLVDTAPNAKLFLYAVGNDLEFAMALKDAIENKIDIITIPLGWANLPTDGTSYITNNVNAAVNEGIVVVVPSGNLAQSHWEGKYADVNSNGWNEFTDNDEGLTFNITPDRIKKEIPLIINLLWDNENAAGMDFDMVLINPSNEIVSFSANVQNTQSDTTFEQIRYIPSDAGTYSVGIVYDGSHENPGIPIEIFSVNDELEHYVTIGSVIVPADADNIIVTGAVNVASGKIEPFSSQGPTNNGYAVPHVLAPNGVSTIAYGDKLFYGTSAAAPYVAGIAALVLEIDPTMSLEEILKDIKENTIPQSSDSSIYCDEIGQCGLIDAALIVPWEKIR